VKRENGAMIKTTPFHAFIETLDSHLHKVTLRRALNLYRLYCFVADNAGAVRLPQDTEAIGKIPYYGFVSGRISRDLKCLSSTGVIKRFSAKIFSIS
jgi:hypothetical protein